MQPRLMRTDNVTPPARTPWGGRVILEDIKRGLDLGAAAHAASVGESWEISVEPSFPSRFADEGGELRAAIATRPAHWLGADHQRFGGQTPLLIKLLDAADNLSIQVHPATDDPALRDSESGKPEAWYILSAQPGAGLYLGFREGVERAHVQQCLQRGGRLDELLNFVPVQPGDAFVLDAGTVHAIGAGVTLLEPQFVTPGRRGVTYRFWDWNRRYDADGQLSPDGAPRALHVERSLAVTDWAGPRGQSAVDAIRSRTQIVDAGPITRTRMLTWPYFELSRWAGRGTVTVPGRDTLLAIVCVGGAARLRTEAGAIAIQRGQSAVVPARAGALTVTSHAHPDDGDVAVELLVTHAV